MTEIKDIPVLQAEDDGFLLHLKWSVLDKHLETLGIDKCQTLENCVDKIREDSAESIDRGSTLPLYLPEKDDDGIIQGSSACAVWSGAHIDVPLYGDLWPDRVESLITGNRIGATSLYKGFMEYSPAFRVALLVHHICQIVLIHPLAAEAFVLGRYDQLPFNDEHFEEYGVPSTSLFTVEGNCGIRTNWKASTPHSLKGAIKQSAHTAGWHIRIRGSQPKQALIREAWREIGARIDHGVLTPYTINGAHMKHPEPAPSGKARKRSKSPEVDAMFAWAEEKILDDSFPKRGKFKDWKLAVIEIGKDYPSLAGKWTSEAMRKAYERRKREAGASLRA